MNEATNADKASRRPWIEPEIEELAVSQTAMFPRTGRDGGRFADCTRS